MRCFALLVAGLLAVVPARWGVADPPDDRPATKPVIEDTGAAAAQNRNLDPNLTKTETVDPAVLAPSLAIPGDTPSDNRALREFREQHAPRDAASRSEASTVRDDWRYKQQNGHWWYWLPNNQWAFWNGSAWVNYTPQSYAAFYSTQQPQAYRSYYRGDGYDDGNNNGVYGGRQYWNGGYYGNRYFAPGWYGSGAGPWAYGYGGRGAAARGEVIGGAIGSAVGGQSGAATGAGIGAAIGADGGRNSGFDSRNNSGGRDARDGNRGNGRRGR